MCSSTSRPSGPADATRTPSRSGSAPPLEPGQNPLAVRACTPATSRAAAAAYVAITACEMCAETPAECTDSVGAPPDASLMERVYGCGRSRRSQPQQAAPRAGPPRRNGTRVVPSPRVTTTVVVAVAVDPLPEAVDAVRQPELAPRRRQADLAAVQVPAQHEVGRTRRERSRRPPGSAQGAGAGRAAPVNSSPGGRRTPPRARRRRRGRPPRSRAPPGLDRARLVAQERHRRAAPVVDDRAARERVVAGADVVVSEHGDDAERRAQALELARRPARPPAGGSRCRR